MRIVSFYPFERDVLVRLERLGNVVISTLSMESDDDIDALDLVGVDAIFGDRPPLAQDRAPDLRWLATAGAGVEYLTEFDFRSRGVVVTNGSGLHAVPIAEYCMGAMYFATQRQRERLSNTLQHGWAGVSPKVSGTGLRGRTVVVVGYGRVGREIGRLASANGMRVFAVKARPEQVADYGWRETGTGDPSGNIPDRIVGLDGLLDIVPLADFVVVVAPLTAASRGLLSGEVLEAMARGAWIVNAGRGPVIDEEALLKALQNGRVGGAYLDVFGTEPLPPSHPFWNLPNVVVTPHIAGLSHPTKYWAAAGDLMVENLRRWLVGRPLANIVDFTRGY